MRGGAVAGLKHAEQRGVAGDVEDFLDVLVGRADREPCLSRVAADGESAAEPYPARSNPTSTLTVLTPIASTA